MIEVNWRREDKRKRKSQVGESGYRKRDLKGGKTRLIEKDAVSLSESKHPTVWISLHEEASLYSHGWSDMISPREKDKDKKM